MTDRRIEVLEEMKDELYREKAGWEEYAAIEDDAGSRARYEHIAEGLEKAIKLIDRRIEEIEKEVE